MELDDLKHTWNEAGSSVQKLQSVNPKLVEKMNNQNYRSKVKKITIPETVGSLVCLAAATFIACSFFKLDTVLLQGAGVLSVLLLLLLPIISTLSTWRLGQAGNVHKPYAETLKIFARQKLRFIRLQKLNVALCYLLLVSILVLLSKLMVGKDLSANKYFWLFSFTVGYVFLLFYSRWVEKYYGKSLQQAEQLLRDLGS